MFSRGEKFENSKGSWVGTIETSVFERRGSHENAVCFIASRASIWFDFSDVKEGFKFSLGVAYITKNWLSQPKRCTGQFATPQPCPQHAVSRTLRVNIFK